MSVTITVESPVVESPRVLQLRGLFDLPAERTSRLSWRVDLPLSERPWNVGLITGPSGCGKSTIARKLWPDEYARAESLAWPEGRAVIDAFPASLSIGDVTALLSAVGFSSPPAWLRPYHALSTGQKFRCDLARLMAWGMSEGRTWRADPVDDVVVTGDGDASMQPRPAQGHCRNSETTDEGRIIVIDEFTSVVDRTVAQVGSAAFAKTVRAQKARAVCVTCHDDVIDWLQPDWVYLPATNQFAWRLLRRRPAIVLDVSPCPKEAWDVFAPHHYLSHALAPSATCLLAKWEGRAVAFTSWLPFVGSGPPARREHRTVTLPDFQGAGIGPAASDLAASAWRGLGYRALSTTTHPGLIRSRTRSPFWVLRRAPSLARGHERSGRLRHATTRLTAGFEYTGPALPRKLAALLLDQ